MTIEECFCNLYGCDTGYYFKRQLRKGYSAEEINKDINEKVDAIWSVLKNNDGFEPVLVSSIPEGFI